VSERALEERGGAALYVRDSEDGPRLGGCRQRVGERARPERGDREGAVGVGVQIGKAREGKPLRGAVARRRRDVRIKPSRNAML